MNHLTKTEVSHGQCTAVSYLEDDLIAVGMSYGLVEVWSLSKSRIIQRFNAGQASVTKIIVGNLPNRIYVSNADGKVFVFDRNREVQSIVPQTSIAAGSYPIVATWSESTGYLAYGLITGQLIMLNLQHNEQSVKYLENANKQVSNKLPKGIEFREKRSEIVIIYHDSVEVLDPKTLDIVKTMGGTTHEDANGRVHSVQSNQHPYEGVIFSDGQFTADHDLANSSASKSKSGTPFICSADMFKDETRLAILAASGDRIHLIIRDIDSEAILSEIRITGMVAPYSSELTCLDDHRVLLTGLNKANSKDPIAVLWNTSNGSLRLSKVAAFTNTTTPPADASGRGRSRGKLNIRLIASRGEVGVWDQSMVQVLNCETLEPVCEASAPVEDSIHFAYFSPDGDVFAVLNRPGHGFGWARWDADAREWITIFESKERTHGLWFVDASRQILYNMQELGTFQRWNATNGDHLAQLTIPTGSIESLQIDRTGVVASLLRSKLLAQMEQIGNRSGPDLGSSINWHRDGIFIRGDRVTCDEEFKNKARFTTEPNNRITTNGLVSRGSHKAAVEFEANERAREELPLLPGKKTSLAALSEDQSCFVKILPDGALHRWRLEGDSESESRLFYRYQGTTTIDDFSEVVRVTLASNGRRLVTAAEKTVRWSEWPFEKWHSFDLKISSGKKITAIRLSADNETLALGLSDGHIVLQPMSSGHKRDLGRGHDGAIHDLLWMPDSRTLTTAGNDGAVVVWDIAQEEIRLRLVGHQGAVKSLAYDLTRNILYSGGDDGRIQPWVAAPIDSKFQKETNDLVIPNPSASIPERIAPPSAALLHTRQVIDWLEACDATYRLANFGILPHEISEGDLLASALNQKEGISLHTVSLVDNQDVSDADLANLADLSELRVLDLTNCKVSPLGVAKLRGLVGLHTLSLSGIDLTGFDFDQLGESSRIQTLILNGCFVSDEQLISIIRLFPMLRELELSHACVTNASASKLHALKLLTTLKLDSSNIDDDFLSVIGDMTKLEVLDLSRTRLSGGNLSTIWSSKWLKELRLGGIPITDAALDDVAALRRLKTFDVRDTAVTEVAVRRFLARSPSVELHVSQKLFGAYPQLEALLELGAVCGEVVIDGKPLPPLAAITAIQNGGSITGLTWPVDPRRSSEDIPVLAKLPKLERISMSSGAIPKLHLPLLAKISGLRSLELRGTLLMADDLGTIASLQQIRSLKVLGLSEEGLKRIQNLQRLDSLNVMSSLHTIDKLARVFPSLRELHCLYVNVKSLTEAIPFLESLESLTVHFPPPKDTWPILAQLKKLKYLNYESNQQGSTYYVSPSDLRLMQETLPGVLIQAKR